MTVTLAQFEQQSDFLRPQIVAYLWRKLSNLEDAEDIMQETQIKAYAYLCGGKRVAEDGLLPWLLCIARCAACDLLRRRSYASHVPLSALPQIDHTMTAANDVESVAERNEDLRRIFALLVPIDRKIFSLIYQGYSSTEIAKLLDITPVAARIRMRRARKAITEALS